MLKALLASNPGLEVTPLILLQFIAARSKHSPQGSPQHLASENVPSPPNQRRGRAQELEEEEEMAQSSSSDSAENYVDLHVGSRPPSRGPPTPSSANSQSLFDASKRQRSTPLGSSAPSVWNRRPAPAHRRRSDAGQYTSDSEVRVGSFAAQLVL